MFQLSLFSFWHIKWILKPQVNVYTHVVKLHEKKTGAKKKKKKKKPWKITKSVRITKIERKMYMYTVIISHGLQFCCRHQLLIVPVVTIFVCVVCFVGRHQFLVVPVVTLCVCCLLVCFVGRHQLLIVPVVTIFLCVLPVGRHQLLIIPVVTYCVDVVCCGEWDWSKCWVCECYASMSLLYFCSAGLYAVDYHYLTKLINFLMIKL
jgi:hypothetical protein